MRAQQLTEYAAGALFNLTNSSDACERIVEAGALELLVALLSQSSNTAAEPAAGAIANLANGSDERCERISSAGALAPLVSLLGHPSMGMADKAAEALDNLSGSSATRSTIRNLMQQAP